MAQPANAEPQAGPWNSNPLHYVRELIANDPKLSPKLRAHILLVCNKIITMNSGDVRQEGLCAGGVVSYGKWATITTEAAQTTKVNPKAQARADEAARAIDHYGKCLRIAGVTRGDKTRKKGKVFTAPRPRNATELAEQRLPGTPLAADPEDGDS